MSESNGLLEYRVKKLEDWQTSIKVTIEETEKVCDFITQKKKYIEDLNIMQKEFSEIRAKNQWILRLIVTSLVTGIAIPIFLRFFS